VAGYHGDVATEHAEPEHAEPEHAVEHASGHRHERPEDWGWHTEMGRTARGAGIVSLLLLLSLLLSTHGSKWELVWLVGFAACLAIALVWDHYRRRNAWRS
jgi:Protein of unknown function (DUF2631)